MIPKSLHTVSALINLATWLKPVAGCTPAPNRVYVETAVKILGYQDHADTHGLIECAVRRMGA